MTHAVVIACVLVVAPLCTAARAAPADSLDAAIDAAIEAGVTGDVGEVVSDIASPARDRNRLLIDAVGGYREAVRVSSAWGRMAGSARWTREASALSLWLRDTGGFERVVAGGVRMRFGEGLVLGNAASSFGAPRCGPRTASIDAATSLWNPRRGAGVAWRRGHTRVGTAAWIADERQRVWAYGERQWTDGATVAVAAGRLEGDDGGPATAVSVAATHAGEDHVAAAEVASLNGAGLGAARIVALDVWCAEVFADATPSGFGAGAIAPEDLARRRVGAALHRVFDRGRLSLYSVRRRIDGDDARRRRVEWRVRHPRERVELVVRVTDDVVWVHGRDAVDPAGRRERSRTAVCRVRGGFAAMTGVESGWMISAERSYPGPAATGVVAGWTLDLRARSLDARVVASAFSLPPGQLGYVSRAGTGGYETSSVVSRRGSEVSARVGWSWRGVRLSGYAGRPKDGVVRALFGIRLAL